MHTIYTISASKINLKDVLILKDRLRVPRIIAFNPYHESQLILLIQVSLQ